MSRHVLLNNIDHHALRVDTARSVALGDNVMSAPVFLTEFRNVQTHYPIVFAKAAEGGWQPVALFGLQEGQNLYLDERGWDAGYVPLAHARQPFLIGRDGDALMVHIDLDSPRVATDRGEPLFREHGGTTDYLDRMTSMLLALHEAIPTTAAFANALSTHGLLESFVLDVEFEDGGQGRLAGFHTINEERVRALDGRALSVLHQAGHLEAIFMAMASLGHLRGLIDRANRVRCRDA